MVAEHRFKRPGIFQKICAHRAANLSRQGYERLSSGDIDGGIERLDQLLNYSPNNVQPLLDISQSLAKAGRLDEARRFTKRALETPDISPKSAAEAKEMIAGLDWRQGELEHARSEFEQVLALHISSAFDRLQMARLDAIARSGEESLVLRSFLLNDLAGPKALVRLGEIAHVHPEDGLVRYLYGRQLENAGAFDEGIREMRAAIESELPSPALKDEARMTLGRLLLRGGRAHEAADVFGRIALHAPSEVSKLNAEDWADRARYVDGLAAVRTATIGP
jgi:Flp pilus assembly protein TadD